MATNEISQKHPRLKHFFGDNRIAGAVLTYVYTGKAGQAA
jgi:hypothetical protein